MTVGTGGTLVEVVDDKATRVPPVSAPDARGAVEETALGELFDGHHDDADCDIESFVELVERRGRLATDVERVAEFDLDPVVVGDDGVTAVDVLVETS